MGVREPLPPGLLGALHGCFALEWFSSQGHWLTSGDTGRCHNWGVLVASSEWGPGRLLAPTLCLGLSHPKERPGPNTGSALESPQPPVILHRGTLAPLQVLADFLPLYDRREGLVTTIFSTLETCLLSLLRGADTDQVPTVTEALAGRQGPHGRLCREDSTVADHGFWRWPLG